MQDGNNDRNLCMCSIVRGGRLYSLGCLGIIIFFDVIAKGIFCLFLLVMGKRIPGYVQFCGWVTLGLFALIVMSVGTAIVSDMFRKGKKDEGSVKTSGTSSDKG